MGEFAVSPPATITDHCSAPVNSLGYLRLMFIVEDLDVMLLKISPLGAERLLMG